MRVVFNAMNTASRPQKSLLLRSAASRGEIAENQGHAEVLIVQFERGTYRLQCYT
jgi:hypothetical protein